MKSLLRRAEELRKAAGSESEAGGYSFDKSSGISREDQKEILLHIDKVAQSSRILAGPDTWKVKPKKHGIALPLIVNVVGLLVLAGGLFAIGKIVSPREEQATSSSAALSSAEGRLLQEIKREAEGRIQDKDREIATIQKRMASLDSEKEQLIAGADARLKAKEDELRSLLKQELEAERARLIATGLSEAQVQARLAEFEKRKSAEFTIQFETFSRKAEDERLALQATIDQARDEYRKTLSVATLERQRIQDESRIREQDLRSQLDEKNKALLVEREKTATSLSSAQAELTRLNEETARIKAVEDRLLGLYTATRQSLRDGRLDDATRSLDALKAYLADTQVTSISALQPRRALDLFATELIERAIGTEKAKASADTGRLSAALDALAVVREEVEKARSALAAGDASSAESSYRRALSATKELKESGAFIEETWKQRFDAQAVEIETARAAAATAVANATATATENAAVEASVAAREARQAREVRLAMESATAATDDRALFAAYSRLLSNLPIGPADASRLYSYIKRSGAKDVEASRIETDTEFAERIAALEASLSATRDELAVAKAEPVATAVTTEPGMSEEYASLKEEKATIEADLAIAKARYKALSSAYKAYTTDEDAILERSGSLALIEARNRLNAFLSSQPVNAAFPGMKERIAFYMSSFQQAGQDEILYNAADIVDGAVRIRDADVRERYFSELEIRYAGNEAMLEFLAKLKLGFSRL